MSDSPDRSACLILNGRAAADNDLRSAVNELRANGWDLQVRATWETGHGAVFARWTGRQGLRRVVAAGGDGTINDVVNGLMALDPPKRPELATLPYGTANDFATSAGLDADGPALLQKVLEAVATPVDVGRVRVVGNGQRDEAAELRYFLNIVSGGFGAEATAEADGWVKDLFGKASYFFKGMARVANAEAKLVKLSGDLRFDGRAYLLFVGNARQCGGGFEVCPAAQLDDGCLDVVVVPQLEDAGLVSLLRELRRYGQPDSEAPERLFVGTVEQLELDGELKTLNLDGEPVTGDRFRFDVAPKAIRAVIFRDELTGFHAPVNAG